jgi:hypothetical protein
MLCVCSNARSIFSYTLQYGHLVLQYVELLLIHYFDIELYS